MCMESVLTKQVAAIYDQGERDVNGRTKKINKNKKRSELVGKAVMGNIRGS